MNLPITILAPASLMRVLGGKPPASPEPRGVPHPGWKKARCAVRPGPRPLALVPTEERPRSPDPDPMTNPRKVRSPQLGVWFFYKYRCRPSGAPSRAPDHSKPGLHRGVVADGDLTISARRAIHSIPTISAAQSAGPGGPTRPSHSTLAPAPTSPTGAAPSATGGHNNGPSLGIHEEIFGCAVALDLDLEQ